MNVDYRQTIVEHNWWSTDIVPENAVSKFSTLTNAVSLSGTPTQPENQPQFQDPAGQRLEVGSESDLTSRSVTPVQSQDSNNQLDAQPDGLTASISHNCPVCQSPFYRVQERNRHVESYLPHSILCPFQGCTWTGRRQWDFKEHWRRKHPEAGQASGEDANEIYKSKDFVKSIVDGKPVEEVARSAFAVAQESLERLGKPGVNVLGRNRDLRNWVLIPSSQPN